MENQGTDHVLTSASIVRTSAPSLPLELPHRLGLKLFQQLGGPAAACDHAALIDPPGFEVLQRFAVPFVAQHDAAAPNRGA